MENKKNASWSLCYQLNHRTRWMGLGSARVISQEQARQRAKEAREKLVNRIDPLTTRQAERAAKAAAAVKAVTFTQAAEAYIAAHRAEWRSAKHGEQWSTTLQRFVYPIIGQHDVALIDKPAVLRVLEQRVPAELGRDGGSFWASRTVTADRVRNRVELVLNYAVARDHRPAGVNPAAWSTLKDILAKPTKTARIEHHAAVPYAELPALFAELRRHSGIAAKALQFLILTARHERAKSTARLGTK